MLIEMRTYQIAPARVADYLRLFESRGLAIQREVLGNLIACFSTEIGPLNQVVYLWGYDSYEERELRRARLAALPEWMDYVAQVVPLFASQDTRLVKGTAFSPIR
ncbi:MAG: NIPSNAP family protein [Pseudomonadota bacterium]